MLIWKEKKKKRKKRKKKGKKGKNVTFGFKKSLMNINFPFLH